MAQQESWAGRIWRLITPELVYFIIYYIVDMAAGMYWGYTMMGDFITDSRTIDVEGFTSALMDILMQYALLLQTIAAFVAIFFLIRMYFKDYRKRRFVFDKKSVKKTGWLWLIPAGLLASLAGNLIINASDLASMSEEFQEAEQILFAGPVFIQIIGIGIVIPVCEELIYRGLIYMRMRQYLHVNMAIIVSALLFAVIHGNPVQGIYAFLLGILFAYAYEKYGSLKAPVILHVSANMMSLGLSLWNPAFDSNSVLLFMGAMAFALCLLVIMVMDRSVSAGRIYQMEDDSRLYRR